jgi:hypothetical protein
MPIRRWAAVLGPVIVAVLELSHPTWSDGSIAQAVVAAGAWWIPLHLLLMAGFALVALLLADASGEHAGSAGAVAAQRFRLGGAVPTQRFRTVTRMVLAIFVVCNTAYVLVDGVVVGFLASSDPATADTWWKSPLLTVVADITGAAWAASLLLVAATLGPIQPRQFTFVALALTWLAFVASAPPVSIPPLASRVIAVGSGAWAVYRAGRAATPFALLVFAAVLRQHVGPEAALGMLCIAAALLTRRPKGR